jgi:ATP/ADP translocase
MERSATRLERAFARLLRPIAPVEPAEGVTVAILTLTVFLLLTAYYLLKTAREPLILLAGGAEVKSYAAAGQALLLLGFVRVYGSFARRAGRLKLLASIYLFFASNLLVFAGLAAADVTIGVPFYLWVGVFNYTSIAQFWAFAADLHSPEQGKRLFAVFGAGSSLGAVAGAKLAHALVGLGPQALMLVATGLLLVCVALIAWVDSRARRQQRSEARIAEEPPLSGESAFGLLVRDRYLLLLAALTLALNWANSNGEYILDRTLLESLGSQHDHHAAAAFIGRFKADYFGWVNLLGVVLQLLVVSRVLTRLGPRVALYFLPVVALGGYGLVIAAPVLALIRVAKIAENSIDYSVQNTARQALYLVATRPEKYVGKTAVDTFFVRFGDVLSAALVWAGTRMGMPTVAFAGTNIALIAVWLGVVVAIGREHRRRSSALAEPEPSTSGAPVKALAGAAVVAAVFTLALPAHASAAKRDVPDYDGRGGEPTTPGDVAIWVPRTVLAPAYLVSEYGVRRPLGALISAAERAQVPAALYDFFFFGPDHKGGIAPIAFVDFGFHPSVGLYAFWDDAFFQGHDLRFHGSTGGSDWLAGSFTDRIRLAGGDTVTLRLAGVSRPDLAFFGTGPDTRQANISRFSEDRLEAEVGGRLALWRSSSIETSLGVRSVDTGNGHFGGDPSLEQRAAQGAFALPYGFERGWTAQTSRVAATFDTRRPRPAPGSGVRLAFDAAEGADVRRAPGSAWVRYGATAGAFIDLNDRNRVLGVSATAQFVDPLGHAPVPFGELVTLGGDGPMPGYYIGRLVDRSAAVAMVHYRWPIWVWLDGSMQASAGNVFGEHLEDFRASRIRFSGSVGVESVGSSDGSFELLVGFGTETIDQGAKVDSVRIAVGTNHGF